MTNETSNGGFLLQKAPLRAEYERNGRVRQLLGCCHTVHVCVHVLLIELLTLVGHNTAADNEF